MQVEGMNTEKTANKSKIHSLPIPPLTAGDFLTRSEFEQRYKSMPNTKKAELIEGIVYMPSPVSHKHSKMHGSIATWVGYYSACTFGTEMNDNGTLRIDNDNEPQPDILLRVDEKFGGNVTVSEDGYLEGAAELIAEISCSTASYDLNQKLHVYRRNGVSEYIVWRVYDNEIDWFILENEKYVELKQDDDGILRSRVFPGLWLDRNAMLNDELNKVMEVLQKGLDSVDHKKFVEQLSK